MNLFYYSCLLLLLYRNGRQSAILYKNICSVFSIYSRSAKSRQWLLFTIPFNIQQANASTYPMHFCNRTILSTWRDAHNPNDISPEGFYKILIYLLSKIRSNPLIIFSSNAFQIIKQFHLTYCKNITPFPADNPVNPSGIKVSAREA